MQPNAYPLAFIHLPTQYKYKTSILPPETQMHTYTQATRGMLERRVCALCVTEGVGRARVLRLACPDRAQECAHCPGVLRSLTYDLTPLTPHAHHTGEKGDKGRARRHDVMQSWMLFVGWRMVRLEPSNQRPTNCARI